MQRSSHGSRRISAWAVAQKPRPMPRIVRLGRPANDNVRHSGDWIRVLVVTLATALVMAALYDWRVL